jgi:hypothetical protein
MIMIRQSAAAFRAAAISATGISLPGVCLAGSSAAAKSFPASNGYVVDGWHTLRLKPRLNLRLPKRKSATPGLRGLVYHPTLRAALWRNIHTAARRMPCANSGG